MPPTSTAPIRETRLNNTLFVGEIGVRTIQAAINYAVSEGGSFLVVIPFGYAGSDTIAGVVNGSTSIILCDQRTPSWQMYTWNGTNYVPANIPLIAASLTSPSNLQLNAGTDDGVLLNYAGGGGYVDFCDGAGNRMARVNQDGQGDFSGGLSTAGDLLAEGAFDLGTDAKIRTDDTEVYISAAPLCGIHLNFDSGGYVDFCNGAGNRVARVNQGGEGDFSGGVTAPAAAFDACEVAGSPVLTRANSGGNMVWPPVGIGVSTGTAWGPSIDPATLAFKNAANTFTATQTFAGINATTITAAADNLQINAGTDDGVLLNYFGGGGYVSFFDGNSTEIGRVNNAGDATFARNLSMGGNATAAGNGYFGAIGGGNYAINIGTWFAPHPYPA